MNIFKSRINRKYLFKRFNRLYSVGLLIAAFTFSQCTGDSNTFDEPPEAVSLLSATVGIGQVELSWTNPGTDFDQVTIFYKQGDAVSGPNDPDAVETNAGTAESYLLTGLTNGKTYHFTVYTYKEAGGYSSAETVSAVPKSPSALPDTGQTAGYTNTYGEDNDYADVPNARSYTDNGDKTVTDNVTGLMWEQLPDSGDHIVKNWADAVTECENRTTAGYADWRLPSVHELGTLLDYNRFSPAINTNNFPNTKSNEYWSLTVDATNTRFAWRVDFTTGHFFRNTKSTNYFYLRCVRGDRISFGVNLTDNADGTVTDADTGLMWQQLEADHTAKSWEAALTYCEDLTHANRSDWRLPNINELKSITDYDSYYPATDVTFFPNTKSDTYLSSTSSATYLGFVWGVTFTSGSVNAYQKTSDYYVRCVRSG